MIDWLEANKKGTKKISYRLRDWLFSRQRYWGEPIPIIHWEDGTMTAVKEEELPLELPVLTEIKQSGTGESPLANSDWIHVVDPKTGMKGRRETNTMQKRTGSSGYFLRFIDTNNKEKLADQEIIKIWLSVDLYVREAKHAVLYLLYTIIWNKFLYNIRTVPTKEPFQKLYNQVIIIVKDKTRMKLSLGSVINLA